MSSGTTAISAKMRAELLETIDAGQAELIAFLQEYVAIPSVNPRRGNYEGLSQEKGCQLWLAETLRGFGCFATVDVWEEAKDRPNIAARLASARDGVAVMFNGHTDTVEVTSDQKAEWHDGDPWSGEVKGGNLYGRGATDMKAGVAAFIWAAKAVGELGIPLKQGVYVTINVGEETAEADVGPLSVLRRGYSAPFVINAEPTALSICRAAVGWLYLRVTVDGRSMHPASRYKAIYPYAAEVPSAGVDAISKMQKVLSALAELERDWGIHKRHPLIAPGTMNLCPIYIEGGDHRSSMSETCQAEFAVVYNPDVTTHEVLAEIEAAVHSVTAADRWLRDHPPRIDAPIMHRIMEPFEVPADHPSVTSLAQAYWEALGREPTVTGFEGASDANIMSEEGVTTIVCGPGDIAFGAHGANEYVPIRQVVDACKIYASLIVEVCGINGAVADDYRRS